jgi:hypothetical protein
MLFIGTPVFIWPWLFENIKGWPRTLWSLASYMLLFACSYCGSLLLASAPTMKVVVSHLGVEIAYGVYIVTRLKIGRRHIRTVFATPEAAVRYSGHLGVLNDLRWFTPLHMAFLPKEWMCFVASRSGKGVCIITPERKYLLSCRNADEAAVQARLIMGIQEPAEEPPPLWTDKRRRPK